MHIIARSTMTSRPSELAKSQSRRLTPRSQSSSGGGEQEDENENKNDEGDDADSNEDEDEEGAEEEPKLKYTRMTEVLGGVYRNGDATSAFVVAGDKMVWISFISYSGSN